MPTAHLNHSLYFNAIFNQHSQPFPVYFSKWITLFPRLKMRRKAPFTSVISRRLSEVAKVYIWLCPALKLLSFPLFHEAPRSGRLPYGRRVLPVPTCQSSSTWRLIRVTVTSQGVWSWPDELGKSAKIPTKPASLIIITPLEVSGTSHCILSHTAFSLLERHAGKIRWQWG